MVDSIAMSVSVPEFDTSPEAIANRLAKVRMARGLTQVSMATALQISNQRWNSYEIGRTHPPAAILALVWRFTGATSDYILFGNESGLPWELLQKLRAQGEEEQNRKAKPA
jgi:transcriptional regulator with XRE-family HTH domain